MREKRTVWMLMMGCALVLPMLWADTMIEAIGYGMTEQQAKNAALRNAVEQGAGIKIFSESVVRDFVALQDILITESLGMVTQYEVVSTQDKGKEQGFEVKIKAQVAKDVNSQWAQIRIILEQKGNPAIMFCLKEVLDGQELPTPTGEYQLVQKFKDLGFKVIDRQWAQDTRDLSKQLSAQDQNYDAITAVATKRGADLVVVGMLEGTFNRYVDWYEGVQGISYNYQFRTKVIRSDTGQVVGSLSKNFQNSPKDYTTMQYSRENAGKSGFAEILREQYLRPMMADILKTWIREIQDGADLVLVVSNVKFQSRDKVIDALRSTPDLITTVFINNYADHRLELRVKSKLNVDDLAQKMEAIQALPLQVVELKKNWLEVRCSE